MRKLIALMLAAVMVMTVLSGCNILEMGTAPTLPKLNYDESTLTAKVEFVNGRTCRVSILEGDGHYDAATEKREADVIFVTYSSLSWQQERPGGQYRDLHLFLHHRCHRAGRPAPHQCQGPGREVK